MRLAPRLCGLTGSLYETYTCVTNMEDMITMRMTLKLAKAVGRRYGFSVNPTGFGTEYRVRPHAGIATDYYTTGHCDNGVYFADSLEDAVEAGIDMCLPASFNVASRYQCAKVLGLAHYSID